jgi:hypothetical protein
MSAELPSQSYVEKRETKIFLSALYSIKSGEIQSYYSFSVTKKGQLSTEYV